MTLNQVYPSGKKGVNTSGQRAPLTSNIALVPMYQGQNYDLQKHRHVLELETESVRYRPAGEIAIRNVKGSDPLLLH